ncbi:MAG: glycosyltransferase family 2 protein [Pseudodesulfovibrio sp.]
MQKPSITILSPVFNDWEAFAILLAELGKVAHTAGYTFNVVAVDDGSIDSIIPPSPCKGIGRVELVRLKRNLGHQKAISLGLAYIAENMDCDFTVVMDSDGEDKPQDVLRLLEHSIDNPSSVIFARRTKRSETFSFKVFYFLYKLFFFILTGEKISFGNFCSIPASAIPRLTYHHEIWMHFSAGIMRSRLHYATISVARGSRYAGITKMNFTSLFIHGVSAISLYIDIVLTRISIFTTVLLFTMSSFGGWVLYIRLFTDVGLPGWATYSLLLTLMILTHGIVFIVISLFIYLNSKSNPVFIPAIEAKCYIDTVEIFDNER